ncbi:MAG: ABC transporter ATP-binding protein [Planctomycetes bacterium]|nr:ABC transporter ATP-binding protein [Planctomycetota bacterium]
MSQTGNAGLNINKLCKSFQDGESSRTVLADLSLCLAQGDTLAIIGPSGSGKSTLLNCIGTLDHPDSGEILLNSKNISAFSRAEAEQYRARKIGFVFQEHHLLPSCTAIENVLLPSILIKADVDFRARAEELLARVGLGGRGSAFPSQLSGGEKQRVAIARALFNKPELLLCDEPTGSLDSQNGDAVAEILLELSAKEKVMVVVVTHNRAFAERFGRVESLNAGRLEQVSGAVS